MPKLYAIMPEKFNIETTGLSKVAVHQVGNKTNAEDLVLSREILDIQDKKLKELLLKFFVGSFNYPELYNFSFSNNDFKLNPVYNYAAQIFEHSNSFHINSINIAKHLFAIFL